MADGIFPTLISKDRNANSVSNVIFTQLSDGSAVVGVTAGSLDVNITNTTVTVDGTVELGTTTLAALENITVSATNLDIRDLVKGIGAGEDSILIFANTVKDGSGTDYVPLVDTDGHLQVDVLSMPAVTVGQTDDAAFAIGTDKVSGAGYLADETTPDSVDEGDIGAARMTLDRKQLFVLVDKTTDANRLVIDSSGAASVNLTKHALTNTNALPISKNNTANTETNPIFVQTVITATSGEEIHDYDTSSAVAADTADNHDYTVAGTTFLLKSIIVAGSGNIKFEVQVGPLASLVTKAVGFLTGRAGDSKQIFFEPAIEVPVTGTGTVRIVRTNRENQATDVYSTIIGNDI